MRGKTLLPMVGKLMMSCAVCCGQENEIFSNERFRFYPDRLESFDANRGVFRSPDGLVIRKDGDTKPTWDHARTDKLYLQTPYPILDAAFFLAVDETLGVVAPAGTKSAMLGADKPGGRYYHPYYYLTRGKDIREYTRDTAQHIQWGDSVIIDRAAAKGTLIRRCDFENKRLREDAVVTADSVHFIPAAWEYFKITGDLPFLSETWDCMSNDMAGKERECRKADGLWVGSPWMDNRFGFFKDHFETRNTSVKSLYANVMAAGAWQALGAIAGVLGKVDEAATCRKNYQALNEAINKHLYRQDFGTYCYYKYEPDQSYYDVREGITAGLLYLFGIADAEKALRYHSGFAATPYGFRNLDPVMPAGERSYGGGNIYENHDAYHGWMLAKLHQGGSLRDFIFWHARAGIILGQWTEGTTLSSTGELTMNYRHVVWGSMGYTCYWTRGVFGIDYALDGLSFAPCVPDGFGEAFFAVLNNFTYRDSTLRLVLRGCGNAVDRVLLDGQAVAVVPSGLRGPHTVELFMKNCRPSALPPGKEATCCGIEHAK